MSIVIAGDVVLSLDEAADGVNNNNPRLAYHNVITASNVTSTEEDADHPLIDITTPVLHQYWKGETDGVQYISVDCGTSTVVNYFGVVGHNLGSTGADIVLQSSSNGSDWTDESTERTLVNDYAFVEEFADVAVRYYRLKITPGTSTVPQIAVLKIGRILRVQRRIYVGHAPSTLSRRTKTNVGRSETGTPLGRATTSTHYETAAQFEHLTPSWYRTYFDPFLEYAADGYFFWCWRPGAYPDEVLYGELTDDVQPNNSLPNGMMSVGINIRGVR